MPIFLHAHVATAAACWEGCSRFAGVSQAGQVAAKGHPPDLDAKEVLQAQGPLQLKIAGTTAAWDS